MLRVRRLAFLAATLATLQPATAADLAPPQRWVYLDVNMRHDENVAECRAVLQRAAKAGYNGVVFTDPKFTQWDQLPPNYARNALAVRETCRELRLACFVGVCSMGYSNDILRRDPNLAEGLPAADVPFVARQGRLVPADDSVRLTNGGFETSRNHVPAGWAFVDKPGRVSFIDNDVFYDGHASLRMQDFDRKPARACQTLAVEPFHHYHVSVMVKTDRLQAAGKVRINVFAKDGTALNYYYPPVEKTQDWKRLDVTFNSLEFREVSLYLGIWGGRPGGTIWWDDVRVEPAGLVNLVRREGTPLRVTDRSRRIAYVEGQDFNELRDPELGRSSLAGGFSAWHDQPAFTLTDATRIRDGQTVLVSHYHAALIHDGRVMCCMAEPKVYELLQWQVGQVHKNLAPDGYFLQHDEIRVQGWDESCLKTRMTPGQLLAYNIKRCAAIVRAEDPGKPLAVWSDMFDPLHNAKKTGRYYLVRGDGPWYGSWHGLDKEIIIVNWNADPQTRLGTLQHFARLGNPQILAGYYDGPADAIAGWLQDARQVGPVLGTMYTTWLRHYDDLEAFGNAAR